MLQRPAGLFVAASLALAVASCHRPKHYDASVEVTRVSVLRKDEQGKPQTMDFEFSYVDCPGTQIEVIRGDKDFAACVSKFKVGEKVPVSIRHAWDDEGFYTYVVDKVGDCPRTPDPADEASFALVRECDDWLVNGARVGFQCRYIPEKKLIAQCPWFKRR